MVTRYREIHTYNREGEPKSQDTGWSIDTEYRVIHDERTQGDLYFWTNFFRPQIFFYMKYIGTQIQLNLHFFDQQFFGPQILLDPTQLRMDPIILGPVLDQLFFFFGPAFFKIKFFFWTANFPKTFLELMYFLNPIFFWTHTLLDSEFFQTQFFWTNQFFGPASFLGPIFQETTFFQPNTFSDPIFCRP